LTAPESTEAYEERRGTEEMLGPEWEEDDGGGPPEPALVMLSSWAAMEGSTTPDTANNRRETTTTANIESTSKGPMEKAKRAGDREMAQFGPGTSDRADSDVTRSSFQ
jgi:hypothetical protein